MPIYEFACDGCGPFEMRRTFKESGDPTPCPACGTVARRVYSVPGIAKTPAALSRAVNHVEKSAYEPEVVNRPVNAEASPGKKSKQSHGRPWTMGH